MTFEELERSLIERTEKGELAWSVGSDGWNRPVYLCDFTVDWEGHVTLQIRDVYPPTTIGKSSALVSLLEKKWPVPPPTPPVPPKQLSDEEAMKEALECLERP